MKRHLILAAALILLIPNLLFAQDTASIYFDGVIQSANASALVINGVLIDISRAQVNSPLVVGTVVHVEAYLAPDGSLIAGVIDPVAPGLIPGLIRIEGTIDQIDGSMIFVNGLRVSTISAQVDFPLNVNMIVIVYAEQTAPGEWSARLVTGLKLGGPIILPAETPEVVASPTPDVSPVVTPEVNAPVTTPEAVAPISTPEVNAPVVTPEVNAPLSTPEVNAPASTPEVGENGEDFEIRGTLQAFTDADLVVNGQRFFIGGARIDGNLAVGVQVRLEIRVVNGQWVLEEIKVTGSGSDDNGGGNSGNSGSSGSNSGSGTGNSGSENSGSGSGNSGSGSGSGNSGSGSSGGGSGNSGSGSSNSGSGSGNSGSGNSGSGSGNSGSGNSGNGGSSDSGSGGGGGSGSGHGGDD